MPRSASLGILQIDRTNVRFKDSDLGHLVAERHTDLLSFCPHLLSLRHSHLNVDASVLNGMIEIEFSLLEADDIQLFPDLSGTSETKDKKKKDLFFAEYQSVLKALEMAQPALLIAAGPAQDRNELQAISHKASDARKLRGSARANRGRTPLLPGIVEPVTLRMPEVSKFLPVGTSVRISCVVSSLPVGMAVLAKISVDRSLGGPNIQLPSNMIARRKIHGPVGLKGPRFLESLDHKTRLILDTVVIDDWVNGEHAELDIVDIVE